MTSATQITGTFWFVFVAERILLHHAAVQRRDHARVALEGLALGAAEGRVRGAVRRLAAVVCGEDEQRVTSEG